VNTPPGGKDGAPAETPAGVQERLAYDRTLLANERTFAAWLRTGLSVAAGGIAVAHLVPEPSRDSLVALALGAVFVSLGIAIMAYGAHQAAQVASRLARARNEPPPRSARAQYLVTALVSVLLALVLLFLWTHQGRPTTP
jgi:putative membrane protein